jgi:hypothetical protein
MLLEAPSAGDRSRGSGSVDFADRLGVANTVAAEV